MRLIFHLFALGVCDGGNANFSVRIGGNANFNDLDTNMLVSPTRKSHVGGITQRQDPTPVVLRCSGI